MSGVVIRYLRMEVPDQRGKVWAAVNETTKLARQYEDEFRAVYADDPDLANLIIADGRNRHRMVGD